MKQIERNDLMLPISPEHISWRRLYLVYWTTAIPENQFNLTFYKTTCSVLEAKNNNYDWSLLDSGTNQYGRSTLPRQSLWTLFISFRRSKGNHIFVWPNICDHPDFQFSRFSSFFSCWDSNWRSTQVTVSNCVLLFYSDRSITARVCKTYYIILEWSGFHYLHYLCLFEADVQYTLL